MTEPRLILSRYKTTLCRNWTAGTGCPFGDRCQFAHGEDELRRPPAPDAAASLPVGYKTKPCVYFMKYGNCAYGDRCKFLHPEAAASSDETGVATAMPGSASAFHTHHVPTSPPPPPPPPSSSSPAFFSTTTTSSSAAPNPSSLILVLYDGILAATRYGAPSLVPFYVEHLTEMIAHKHGGAGEGGDGKGLVGCLSKQQLAKLVEAAAEALNPQILTAVLRLVDPAVHGDWTLLDWDHRPGASRPEAGGSERPRHTGNRNVFELIAGAGGTSSAAGRIGGDTVVYCGLLHAVVLKTYAAGCSSSSSSLHGGSSKLAGNGGGDQRRQEEERRYQEGVAVIRAICERRPAAVVDFLTRGERVTPVEALLEQGGTELSDRHAELIRLVAPLTWLRSAPGWAGQRRALALCEHMARQAAAAAAAGERQGEIEPEGWMLRGSVLQAMLDKHQKDLLSMTLASAAERMPHPSTRHIKLPPLELLGEQEGEEEDDGEESEYESQSGDEDDETEYETDSEDDEDDECEYDSYDESEDEDDAVAVATAAKAPVAASAVAAAAGKPLGGMSIFKGIFGGPASAPPAGASSQGKKPQPQLQPQSQSQSQRKSQATQSASASASASAASAAAASAAALRSAVQRLRVAVPAQAPQATASASNSGSSNSPAAVAIDMPNLQAAVAALNSRSVRSAMTPSGAAAELLDKEWKAAGKGGKGGGKKGGGKEGEGEAAAAAVDDAAALAAVLRRVANVRKSAEAAAAAEVVAALRECAWRAATEYYDVAALVVMARVNLPRGLKWCWESMLGPALQGGQQPPQQHPPQVPLLQRLLETGGEGAWAVARAALGRNLGIVREPERNPVILALRRGAPAALVSQLAAAAAKLRRDWHATEPWVGAAGAAGQQGEEGAPGELTAVGWALRLKRMDVVPELLLHTDPRDAAVSGLPPLHHAVIERDEEAVAVLLDPNSAWWQLYDMKGPAELASQMAGGVTPLFRAVENGHVEIVRLLLGAGADPVEVVHAPQWGGGTFKDTAVHLAVLRNDVELLRLLLLLEPHTQAPGSVAGGATCDVNSDAQQQQRQQQMAQALTLRVVDGERCTALALAVRMKLVGSIEALLQAGVDPTALRDVAAATGGGAGGGKGGKKAGGNKGGAGGGALTRQNARLRAAAGATASKGGSGAGGNSSCSADAGGGGGGGAESILSSAVCGVQEEGMQDVLRVLLATWRPAWSGTALRPGLAPAVYGRVREWLLKHADVTLWPVVKTLTGLAATSDSGTAAPPWLSVPLLELLMHLCRPSTPAPAAATPAPTAADSITTTLAAAADSIATSLAAAADSFANTFAAAADSIATSAAAAAGSTATSAAAASTAAPAAAAASQQQARADAASAARPRVAVWNLISGAVVTSITAAAAAGASAGSSASGSSGSAAAGATATATAPAFLTAAMLQELLERGWVDPNERMRGTPPGGMATESCLLHKACFTGDVSLLSVLLAAGADMRATDAAGNTPMHVAASRPHREEIADALIKTLLGRREGATATAAAGAAGGKPAAGGGGGGGGAVAVEKGREMEAGLAALSAAVEAESRRLEVLRAVNDAGQRPEDAASNKRVRRMLQQLQEEVSGSLNRARKALSEKQQWILKQQQQQEQQQQEQQRKQRVSGSGQAGSDPRVDSGKGQGRASTDGGAPDSGSGAAAPTDDKGQASSRKQKCGTTAAAGGGDGGSRRIVDFRTVADLADDDAVRTAGLSQLVGVPEPLVLPLAAKLAKLLPANCIRATAQAAAAAASAADDDDGAAADTDAANAATDRELRRIVGEMRAHDGAAAAAAAAGDENEHPNCTATAVDGTAGGTEAESYSDDDAPPVGEELLREEEEAQLVGGATGMLQGGAGAAPAAAAGAAGGRGGGGGGGEVAWLGGSLGGGGGGEQQMHPLRGLAWRFVITRQAYEAWGRLPDVWRRVVLERLRVIGSGYWARCRGAKKLTADDPLLAQQELWRLKISRPGRILFEVAVEYDEESRTWAEMIRLWFITLNHKAYEDMITLVRASFRRTLAMRERLRLQPLPHHEAPPLAGTTASAAAASAASSTAANASASAGRAAQRLPRHYREAGTAPSSSSSNNCEGESNNSNNNSGAGGSNGNGAKRNNNSNSQQGQQQLQQQQSSGSSASASSSLREHFPPASWAADTYTLMKFYNLDATLVGAVLQGLEAAKVDFPFKLSPQEYDLITLTPHPPSSIILLGRSGTGKTTCAVYRLWGNWLRHHTQPGLEPVHAVFVTASATLRERVAIAFRRLQSAVLSPAEYAEVCEVSSATYHSFREVPSEAFPLFLSSRAYLRMLDGTLARPFFPRAANGAIQQLPDDGEELDPDGAALVVALDEDASDDEEEDEAAEDEETAAATEAAAGVALEEEVEAAAAEAAAAARRTAAEAQQDVQDGGAAADAAGGGGGGGGAEVGDGDGYGLGVAGRARLSREVTYQYFVSSLWKRITTPEQRDAVSPGLVYQEIMSYLKGSAEAITSAGGSLPLDKYLELGRKRAANFSTELREKLVWPIFEKYQRLKRQEWRYDLLDLVGHVYREIAAGGYHGTPIHALYRDEVQDFTQAELLLDLLVGADPNCLFYCGDTAQTIARGIGFRFADICTLFHNENERRQRHLLAKQQQQAAAAAAGGEVGRVVQRRGHGITIATPPIHQLTMNYRTHQGVLDAAALVVDLLRHYFPAQLDALQRERALFPGPHPLLLGGISADDLAILLSGADRNTSQVEFGAHQVILVRSMASVAALPRDIQDSNAIIMTVPQAKGLEFDDVFIVDFFADSEAGPEWRVLADYLSQLQAGQGVPPGEAGRSGAAHGREGPPHKYELQKVTPPDPGAVRRLEFEPGAHVLLSEELKHLYTAITRAKNNVVIFDRNPAKRAPFYHLLQSCGIARTVHRSLLEDGRDAVRYGLTQQATSSRAEWAKRARNLMENRNYAMARKAFLQAGDQVRAEVADAYQKRQRAAEEPSAAAASAGAGAGGPGGGGAGAATAAAAAAEQRRLLAAGALQLLAASSRAGEAPDPVEPGELKRWLGLAEKCLKACGLAPTAAELAFKAGNHARALRLLLAGKQHRAAADCCLAAATEAMRQMYDNEAAAAAAADASVAATDAEEEAAAAAAACRQKALLWLCKAVEQVFLANDLEELVRLLAPPELPAAAAAAAKAAGPQPSSRVIRTADGTQEAAGATAATSKERDEEDAGDDGSDWLPSEDEEEDKDKQQQEGQQQQQQQPQSHPFAPLVWELHDMLRRRWVGSYGRALQRVALRLATRGGQQHRTAAAVVRLMPGEAERDALLAKLGYWRERARLKRSTDPLGAAQLLLEHGDMERAVRLVCRYLAGRAPTKQQQQQQQQQPPKHQAKQQAKQDPKQQPQLVAAGSGSGSGAGGGSGVWAPVDARAWELLYRCIMAQMDVKGARKLRRHIERLAPPPVAAAPAPQEAPTSAGGGGSAAAAATAAASGGDSGGKVLSYLGHALLLEARLMLQPWVSGCGGGGGSSVMAAAAVAGGGGKEKKHAKENGSNRAVPETWEEDGDHGSKGAGVSKEHSKGKSVGANVGADAIGTVAAVEARELLLQAAECFSRSSYWPGQLEALNLITQFGYDNAGDSASGVGATAAAAAASTPAAAPAAGTTPLLRRADTAALLVRAAQAAADALNASRTTALTVLQRQYLAALEQLYGMPGLARWDEQLPATQATHVWRALVRPEAGAVTASATAAAKAATSAGSYAAAASKAAAQQSHSAAAGASAGEVSPLAATRVLLTHQFRAAAKQAPQPDAAKNGGLLLRNRVASALARDVAVKAACTAHQALQRALEAYMKGLTSGAATDSPSVAAAVGTAVVPLATAAPVPMTSERVLAALRPVVRAARVSRQAVVLLRSVESKAELQAAALQRSFVTLWRRALAAVATAPLAPAQAAALQSDLLQPSMYGNKSGTASGSAATHGSLLELLVSESLPKIDLHDWVKEVLVNSTPMQHRLALAPAASYTAWRTLTLVLRHDEMAKRIFGIRSGRLPHEIPASRMLRVGGHTALPEYLLLQAFGLFSMGLPHRALGDVLYYLAWCARRDGVTQLLTATTAAAPAIATAATAATATALGAAASSALPPAATTASAAATETAAAASAVPHKEQPKHQPQQSTPAPAASSISVPSAVAAPPSGVPTSGASSTSGRALPLEAYTEVAEVMVGQLLLAACDSAFLAANVAGTLGGLPMLSDPRDPKEGLAEVAAQWNRLLGYTTPVAAAGAAAATGGRMVGGGGSMNAAAQARRLAEYYRNAADVRRELGKQLVLGARLVVVLAAHVARQLRTATATATAPSEGATAAVSSSGGGDSGAGAFLTEELLPLIEAPTRVAALELMTTAPAAAGRPAAGGGTASPRLVALARRVLLAAASAWLSLELQERLYTQQQSGGGGSASASAAAAAAAELQRPPPRGGWPAEVLRLFKEACGTLAEVVAPSLLQSPQARQQQQQQQPEEGKPSTAAAVVRAGKELTLTALADNVRQLAAAWCKPGVGMRLVDARNNREFTGFGQQQQVKQFKSQAILFAVAQAKVALPHMVGAAAQQQQLQGQGQAAAQLAADSGRAGIIRNAAAAVEVVAGNDYRQTRDEVVRQGEAATAIQRAWRAWRRRREEAAAAAAQRLREREVLERLRCSLRIRVNLRASIRRVKQVLQARRQPQSPRTPGGNGGPGGDAGAGFGAGAGGAGGGVGGGAEIWWDEFGFADVEKQLQNGELRGAFIDEAVCPVCPPKTAAAASTPGPAAMQHLAAEGDADSATAAASSAGAGAVAKPSLPFADFTPHMKKQLHVEACQGFRACHAWFWSPGGPAQLLAWSMTLLQQAEEVKSDMEGNLQVYLMDAALTLEAALTAVRQHMQHLLASRAWVAGPSQVHGPLKECQAAAVYIAHLLGMHRHAQQMQGLHGQGQQMQAQQMQGQQMQGQLMQEQQVHAQQMQVQQMQAQAQLAPTQFPTPPPQQQQPPLGAQPQAWAHVAAAQQAPLPHLAHAHVVQQPQHQAPQQQHGQQQVDPGGGGSGGMAGHHALHQHMEQQVASGGGIMPGQPYAAVQQQQQPYPYPQQQYPQQQQSYQGPHGYPQEQQQQQQQQGMQPHYPDVQQQMYPSQQQHPPQHHQHHQQVQTGEAGTGGAGGWGVSNLVSTITGWFKPAAGQQDTYPSSMQQQPQQPQQVWAPGAVPQQHQQQQHSQMQHMQQGNMQLQQQYYTTAPPEAAHSYAASTGTAAVYMPFAAGGGSADEDMPPPGLDPNRGFVSGVSGNGSGSGAGAWAVPPYVYGPAGGHGGAVAALSGQVMGVGGGLPGAFGPMGHWGPSGPHQAPGGYPGGDIGGAHGVFPGGVVSGFYPSAATMEGGAVGGVAGGGGIAAGYAGANDGGGVGMAADELGDFAGVGDEEDEDEWMEQPRRDGRRNRYKRGGGGAGGRRGGGYSPTASPAGKGGAAGAAAGGARHSAPPQQQQLQQQANQAVAAALRGNAFAPLLHAGGTPPKQQGGKKGGGRRR